MSLFYLSPSSEKVASQKASPLLSLFYLKAKSIYYGSVCGGNGRVITDIAVDNWVSCGVS